MNKFLFKLVMLFCLAWNGSCMAGDKASAEDAVMMVKKAVAYIKENGREKAFEQFQNPAGGFRDRELYVFVDDLKGKVLAQGANPKMVGKDTIEVRDMDGKFFVREFIELAKAHGKGWINYKWPNPVSKKMEEKATYVELLDDIVVGCGIYK